TSTGNGKPDLLDGAKLEVAVLERDRPRRAFRRITGAALTDLLPVEAEPAPEPEAPAGKTGAVKKKPVTDVDLPPNDDKS
ncbi:proteasome subunit alpha, partial [Saccharothrix sp. MB29]|nr:proteasome subunit alpha [Saccharothrix sp. MB29]